MVDAQLVKYSNVEDVYFQKNRFFCHLKLDIVLAIPASNVEKTELKTSAGEGLTH